MIGTTNTSSTDLIPALNNYGICGTYPGTLPGDTTETIMCSGGTIGRYIIIQRHGINFLAVCELQVFGEIQEGMYLICHINLQALIDIYYETLVINLVAMKF